MFVTPPHVTLMLRGNGAARHGRRVINELVGAESGSIDLRQTAALAVSELVTNAIRAAGECSMSAWYRADRIALRVEVTDTSPELPVMQRPDDRRVGGHGLRIVDSISSKWGVIEHIGSKTVWFEMTPDG